MTTATITPEIAAAAAEAIGLALDDEAFDLEALRRGMTVELEHGRRSAETNVTDDDPVTTAKIALAHLRELPDYYDRLATIEGDEG
ncbi:MAG TPA: DUF5661 family protein [Candidatus Limnocylindrales bacterium]|nr:DUF5661 family protein [Candidatus Limnocylindrales bacterium]